MEPLIVMKWTYCASGRRGLRRPRRDPTNGPACALVATLWGRPHLPREAGRTPRCVRHLGRPWAGNQPAGGVTADFLSVSAIFRLSISFSHSSDQFVGNVTPKLIRSRRRGGLWSAEATRERLNLTGLGAGGRGCASG